MGTLLNGFYFGTCRQGWAYTEGSILRGGLILRGLYSGMGLY